MRRRLEAGLDLHDLSFEQHKALAVELLEEMLASTAPRGEGEHGFVCDRCPLDMAAFWLYYRFAFDLQATERYMQRVTQGMQQFDAVVVLPRDAILLENDGVRSANPWVQMHFDALLEAFIHRLSGSVQLLRLPRGIETLDDRVSWVCGSLVQPAELRLPGG